MCTRKLITIVFAVFLIIPITAKAKDPVYFADENLEAAVREALGITEPTPIYPSDMLGLTELYANGKGIIDLNGIQFAKNLGSLSLASNNLSNISVLSELTRFCLKTHDFADNSYIQ